MVFFSRKMDFEVVSGFLLFFIQILTISMMPARKQNLCILFIMFSCCYNICVIEWSWLWGELIFIDAG